MSTTTAPERSTCAAGRTAPQVSQTAKEEVEEREKELQEAYEGSGPEEPKEFSEKTEQELTSPRMGVFQRLYTVEGKPPVPPEETEKYNNENEEYLEREHKEVRSSAEMLFVNADGHHHWHLQHVAKYSLWNADRIAEVAPAQKVGFCLEDSEHVEASRGRRARPTPTVWLRTAPSVSATSPNEPGIRGHLPRLARQV